MTYAPDDFAIEGEAFPKVLRLRRKPEFDRVFQEGRSFRNGLFLLMCAPNGLPVTRIGLMVGRRFGKAFRRNRLKRLCREAFRLSRQELPEGLDFVVLPKAGPESYTLKGVQDSFRRLLRAAQTRFST